MDSQSIRHSFQGVIHQPGLGHSPFANLGRKSKKRKKKYNQLIKPYRYYFLWFRDKGVQPLISRLHRRETTSRHLTSLFLGKPTFFSGKTKIKRECFTTAELFWQLGTLVLHQCPMVSVSVLRCYQTRKQRRRCCFANPSFPFRFHQRMSTGQDVPGFSDKMNLCL